MATFWKTLFFVISAFILLSCNIKPGPDYITEKKAVVLEPDYTGIIIPPNIAPLNFIIREEGSAFFVRYFSGHQTIMELFSGDKSVKLPGKKWKRMLADYKGKSISLEIYVRDPAGLWKKYNPVEYRIAKDPIDRYLVYRIIHPGYESWSDMSIEQRDLENFSKHPVIENSIADDNCVNCHSVSAAANNTLMFHMRGSMGGTYFLSGDKLEKYNLKTKEMKNGAVYPRWHPSGKFIAFSSNKIIQQFHSSDNNKVEVTDLESSIMLYDVVRNEMNDLDFPDREISMDTYPEWSPDGKYLYFCRATRVGEIFNFKDIKYNLWRISFDAERRVTGEPELLFDALRMNKSVSFPRVSPDGRFLVMTLHDYGCFPIWHKEADLWSIDLSNNRFSKMDLNSDYTDSYHSWSSNSKWLVFSSRRDDGLTTRPYISYIDENGNASKPFILPQSHPEFYRSFLRSFNVPELTNAFFDPIPGKIRKIAKEKAVQAGWSKPK
jgi:hypothetical protein